MFSFENLWFLMRNVTQPDEDPLLEIDRLQVPSSPGTVPGGCVLICTEIAPPVCH